MIKIIKKAGNFFLFRPYGEGDHRRWWRGYNFPGIFNQNVKKSREKLL